MEELGIKIYLDDKKKEEGRDPSITYPKDSPDFWYRAYNYAEFCDLIKSKGVDDIDFISFDHDLADFDEDGNEKTGMDCAKFLANYCMDHGWVDIPLYNVHSDNPVGAQNITSYLESYKKVRTGQV